MDRREDDGCEDEEDEGEEICADGKIGRRGDGVGEGDEEKESCEPDQT